MRKQTRNKTMLPTTKTDDWRFEFRYARNWAAFYTSLYSQSWLKSITASYKQLRQGQDMLTATETPLAVRIYVMFVIWKCYIVSDKPQDIFGESLIFFLNLRTDNAEARHVTCVANCWLTFRNLLCSEFAWKRPIPVYIPRDGWKL